MGFLKRTLKIIGYLMAVAAFIGFIAGFFVGLGGFSGGCLLIFLGLFAQLKNNKTIKTIGWVIVFFGILILANSG